MDGTCAVTSRTAVAGGTVIDPQVFMALVRRMGKEVSDSLGLLMERVPDRRPRGDIRARIMGMHMPGGAGFTGGSDQREAMFTVRVSSDGVKDGERTNDNRIGAAAAAVMEALEGRSASYTPKTTPPESEPEGVHVLSVTRVSLDTEINEEFVPSGAVILTASCTIVRDTGRGMLPIPA